MYIIVHVVITKPLHRKTYCTLLISKYILVRSNTNGIILSKIQTNFLLPELPLVQLFAPYKLQNILKEMSPISLSFNSSLYLKK
jgi:hypothetical protein